MIAQAGASHRIKPMRVAGALPRHRTLRGGIVAILVLGLLLAGLAQVGDAVRIIAKAQIAQWLIGRAWDNNLAAGHPEARPWSWADMKPVAKIGFTRQRDSAIVLDSDAARVLAFGPGLSARSAAPGRAGNVVISGHRDTHFSLLQNIRLNDPITLQTIEGHVLHYRVSASFVVDEHDTWVAADHGLDELTLITCWPFDTLVPGGPLRLVVTAERI